MTAHRFVARHKCRGGDSPTANAGKRAAPCWRRRFFQAALAIVGLFGVPARQSSGNDTTDALLDECIAGIQANLALIEHGTATYRVKPRDNRSLRENTRVWTLKVAVDYPRRRFVLSHEKLIDGRPHKTVDFTISDGDQRIWHRPAPGDLRLPSANGVEITPDRKSAQVTMEPRQQRHGSWGDPPSFAWEIEYMRRIAPDKLTARRDEQGRIEIRWNPPKDDVRGVFWVSPHEGYALVRAHEWAPPWNGREPSKTYEAKFIKANNGAYVVSYRHERILLPRNGALALRREQELWLDEVDLMTRPAEAVFTLEGLNLPKGAPIHDRLHGREYRYGVAAVTESDIGAVETSGPTRLHFWMKMFNLGICGALVFWIGRRLGGLADRARGRPCRGDAGTRDLTY